jgi:hypothetical protein
LAKDADDDVRDAGLISAAQQVISSSRFSSGRRSRFETIVACTIGFPLIKQSSVVPIVWLPQSKQAPARTKHDGKHPFNQNRGINMKQTRLVKILAAGAACAAAVGLALAQDTSTTTTTAGSTGASTTSTSTLSGSGAITSFTPGSDYIMFRTEASAEPVKYYYSKNTTVVDPEGKTVEWSALRPDMPVTYTYTRDGDRMVITKMTLTKPLSYYEKKETTTTTTSP